MISKFPFQCWWGTIPMLRSICFSFILVMVSNHISDALGDASLRWIPLAFRAPRNYSSNSLILGDLFLHVNGLCCQMYWRRIALAAAAAAAAFRGGRGTRIEEATVSRCMLEGSTFVLTLFESCEPCPWYSTASLEDSRHTSLRVRSFARNEEQLFTMSELWRWISFTNLSWPRLIKIHTEYPGELSDGTCTSIPGTSIIVAISIFKTGPVSMALYTLGFWALYIRCTSKCAFPIRHHQE